MEVKISKNKFPNKREGCYLVIIPVIKSISNYFQEIEVGPFNTPEHVIEAVLYVRDALIDSHLPKAEFNLLKVRLDKICDWPIDNHSGDCAQISSYSVKYRDGKGNEYPVQVA